MNKYDLSPDLKNLVYSKWLNHDLKTSFKKFGNYPGKYYYKLIDEANELLDIIPDEIMDDLNFYLKILYKIVKNRDVPSLLSFAHLEDDLKKDPQMELDIGEEYLQYIDLDCNSYEDEFEVFVSDVFNDDKNLYLEFEYHVDFLAKTCPHKINIYLIENDENIQLNVINNHVIVIPLDLLKDKYHSKIKVSYQTGTFCYESFIRNYSRRSIRYANYDIDLGIGINNILYLDVKRKTQNNVVINKISFDDGEFIFNCEALNPVRNVVLTNYVTYRKIVYPAIHSTTSNRFIFVVPFNDLKGNIINKWELNCPDSYNSIVLDKEFRFELENCKIVFKNKRNKIYVANKYIIESDIINKLKSKNKELTKQNKKLSKENAKLNNTVQEFKSRKLIRMADSVKRRF